MMATVAAVRAMIIYQQRIWNAIMKRYVHTQILLRHAAPATFSTVLQSIQMEVPVWWFVSKFQRNLFDRVSN